MARKFLSALDLNKNELQNVALQNLSSAPSSPVAGQIYFNTVEDTHYVFSGTSWLRFTPSGAISNADIASDAAIALSKLATDPLARANHTGTQTSSTISDLATTVKGYRLDEFADPTSAVTMNGQLLSGLADPVSPQDAATKNYVDDAVAGLSWKDSVHLLAISNVALAGSTGTLVIDGHDALTSVEDGYRLLLTAQTTEADKGIYVYNDNGTTYTLTRSGDADSPAELLGATVFVKEGTTYGTSSWVQSTHYLTTFSGQSWVQFNGAAQISAGNGLTKDGNQIDAVGTADRITVNADNIDIASTYVGQSSITTVGTVTSGTWNGTTIDVAHGGTGATTAVSARTNLSSTSFALPQKYSATNGALTQSSGVVTWITSAGTHGLGAVGSLIVQMKEVSTGAVVDADIVINESTGDIVISWNSASNVTAGTYRVTAIG